MRRLGISIYPDKSDTNELTRYIKIAYEKAGEYLFSNDINVYEEILYDEA